MCNQVRGAATRLWLGTQQFRFLRLDTEETQNPVITDVSQDTIRGSLDPHDDDVVSDVRVNRFTVRMQPNPAEWLALLPLLGFTNGGSGGTWNLVTNFTTMLHTVWVDYQTEQHKLTEAIIDKMVGRCSKGGTPLTLDLSFIAKVESTDSNLPSSNILAGRPYMMKHATTLTLEGGSHTPNMVAWGIDHHVDAEYNNSETATDNCPATRQVFFATSVPYFTSAQRALYSTRRDSPDSGAAGVMKFLRGSSSMQWEFGRLRLVPKPPAIMGKLKEVRNGLFYMVTRTDASPLMRVITT
jgi:hypothetical protein